MQTQMVAIQIKLGGIALNTRAIGVDYLMTTISNQMICVAFVAVEPQTLVSRN